MYENYLIADSLDQTINAHPICKPVVPYVGLPKDQANMTYWNEKAKTRPLSFLLNTNPFALKDKLKNGSVKALFAHRPQISSTIATRRFPKVSRNATTSDTY